MSEAATAAKRAQIAQSIRDDAAKLDGKAKMLRQFESLCYEPNADATYMFRIRSTTLRSMLRTATFLAAQLSHDAKHLLRPRCIRRFAVDAMTCR